MTRWALSAACASLFAFAGPLRGDEPEQEPAKLFESLDSNQDQLVTSDEVGEDRQRFFDRIVRIGDSNQDGQLSREEFVVTLAAQDESPAENREDGASPERRRGPDRGVMFERLDRNRDGKITKDEIPEGAPEEVRQRLNRLFERAGKDELTREDFAGAAGDFRRPPQGGRPEMGIEVFKRWDKNGDEKLSRDEIPEFARPRFGRLFDRLGSDTVSFDDLAKAAERREEQRAERGDRDEARRDSDRRPDGERRPGEDRGREGDRRPPQEQMTRRPDGDRPGNRGFGPGRSDERRGGPALLRVLDTDRNGRLSRDEVSKLADKFSELDRNDDDQLDGFELFAFGGGFGGRMGTGSPDARFGGPARGGERPDDGDRPRRPAFDREPGDRGPGDRGPRDDGDARRPEGERRDGDRPRPPQDRGSDDRARGDDDRPGRPDGQAFRGGRSNWPEARFASEDRSRDGDRRGPQFAGRGRGPDFLARIDRNRDGAISKDEATVQMREKFERLDADSDGKVTFEEFHLAILREYGLDQQPE